MEGEWKGTERRRIVRTNTDHHLDGEHEKRRNPTTHTPEDKKWLAREEFVTQQRVLREKNRKLKDEIERNEKEINRIDNELEKLEQAN